jgi:hypothetical protein
MRLLTDQGELVALWALVLSLVHRESFQVLGISRAFHSAAVEMKVNQVIGRSNSWVFWTS